MNIYTFFNQDHSVRGWVNLLFIRKLLYNLLFAGSEIKVGSMSMSYGVCHKGCKSITWTWF